MPTTKPNRNGRNRRVLGRVAADEFVGRADELRRLSALAPHGARGSSLLLLAAPSSGATELLRQAYDDIFNQRGNAAPVYFAFTPSDVTAFAAARRFLQTFLTQVVAQRRYEPGYVTSPPTLEELLELAAPEDYQWAERLVQADRAAREGGDEHAFVRLCFGAPQQAAMRGARSVVLLDDVHHAEQLRGGERLGAEVLRAAAQADVPYVISGLRRRLHELAHASEERSASETLSRLNIKNLREQDALALAQRLAERLRVPLNEETRDLVVQQFGGSPFHITALMRAAEESATPLTSYRDCQQLYTDELMGGRINRRFNSLLERIAPSPPTRRAIVRSLYEAATNVGGRSPAEAWRRRLNLDAEELQRVMRELHTHELANFNAAFVEVGTDPVWRDYLRASYRIEVAADARALVVAETLVEALKRAPQTMARHYRRESSMGLRSLLRRFNFQRVPASLLRHDRFARMYKGVTPEEIAAGLDTETDLVHLPQVVNTSSAASFQPAMLNVCDEERCAVAHGFDSTPYTDASEAVWVVAEIESKMEAGRALAETWCDRLTQLARACDFQNVRLWLVAPEGFSAEAGELLAEREAFSSSRQQLELLAARVHPESRAAARSPAAHDEFEMVIPMGDDTELIAAHTVEQIARRLEFQPDEINQIKTALVEACINAAEHSLSPDRKIYQRFRVENDKLVVTVSSRGVAILPAAQGNELTPGSENGGTKGRRGWGLKLIRTLMDEVEFERVDDGTRLRMAKYLRK